MSEFKAKTDKPLKFDIQEIWNENSCLIEDDVFSLSMVAGKSILGRADFTRAITPLLTAYTTTRAELETVKAELDRGKWVSVSEGKPTILEDGESESVLACTRIPLGPKGEYEHHILIAYVKYTNKGWIWREDGKPVANIITHWQPLPTPPHKN